MKILSPAGNFESLRAAVYNGADEVYLGINDFNARNNIDGFTMENLKDAVDFAHVFGVKVHLAINILFLDSELQSALDTVVKAYNIGVDAFIVQDLGLAKLLCENYPEIELHASTQMGLHNLEGVKAVQKFGFRRVVLARETPLEEIKRIRENTDVEIEYFAQGALCISFSGNCYMSSYLFNASGNRGRCKQLCRLPFTLKKQEKVIKKGYLLSAKEFNLSERLEQLKNAGVDAIKIEGRARRPYYVGAVTSEYRRALIGGRINQDELKLAFNRGYTAGYFDGNGKIISELQNHIGIFIGKVESVKIGKTFNEVFFYSNRKLSPKSTIKIFDSLGEKAVVTAYDLTEKEGKYRLTTTQKLSVGDSLNLIIDAKKEEELFNYVKKRQIKIKVFAKTNQPIKAVIKLDDEQETVLGEVLSEAKSQPLSISELLENFKKSEFFDVKLDVCVLDSVFIAKSKLNEFRRTVLEKIYKTLTEKYRREVSCVKVKADEKYIVFKDFEFVDEINKEFTAKNIIYSPETYDLTDVKDFIIKCERLNKCAYLDTPNFALKKDIEILKGIIENTGIKIVANNYYALSFDTQKVIGGGLNVYNSASASYYNLPIIASESGLIEKTRFPVMTFRHCPMKAHLNANCSTCTYSDGYVYQMESGQEFLLKRKKISTCTFYLTEKRL